MGRTKKEWISGGFQVRLKRFQVLPGALWISKYFKDVSAVLGRFRGFQKRFEGIKGVAGSFRAVLWSSAITESQSLKALQIKGTLLSSKACVYKTFTG